VGVTQRHFGGGGPSHSAIRPGLLLLLTHHWLARPYYFLFILVSLLGVFCGEKVKVGLADRLVRVAQPKGICVSQINPGEAALAILEVDRVGQIVHEGVEEVPFPNQRLFCPLLVGNVPFLFQDRFYRVSAMGFHETPEK
jgi:hypothetical protein